MMDADVIEGWLMISIMTLTVLNAAVLLSPPQQFIVILELMPLPFSARSRLLVVAMLNVVGSMVFEQGGSEIVGKIMGKFIAYLRRGRRRWREGQGYKIVESGMR